jgi:CRISPR/Cas system-associated protein Csm6
LAQVVPLSRVIYSTDTHSSRYSTRKMESVLIKQGQIEPLQVKVYSTSDDGVDTFITFDDDAHAADIVKAASNLAWSTILIVVVPRYIP